MHKKQRKDIIDQIKDLSKSRKSVYIKDLNAQGIYFSDDIPEDIGEGQDSLITWNRVTYYQDNTALPTEAMFADINNLIRPSISSDDIVSLSGLSDANIKYQLNSKYSTIIKVQKTLNSYLTITGKCRATVYLDDHLVIRHDFDPLNQDTLTTTSPINIPFNKEGEHTIHVYTYGHLNRTETYSVGLSGDVFNFIEYSRLLDVAMPLNVFATDNLVNQVKVSWDQAQGVIGPGGGVEVWAKQEEIDTEYSLLSRIPFPTDSFLHTEQIGGSGMVPNSKLQYYNIDEYADPLGRILPESEKTDGTGLVYWEVDYGAGVGQAKIMSSVLSDQTYAIDYSLYNRKVFTFDNIVGSTLKYPAESDNLNLEAPIVFDYASTYFIKLDTDFAPLNGTTLECAVVFTWDFDPEVTDAQVQCIVYKNGTPVTNTVDANLGTFTYELSFIEQFTYLNDPTYIDAEFKTTAALRNSDPATTKIYFNGIVVNFTGGNTSALYLESSPFSLNAGDEYEVSILVSEAGETPTFIGQINFFDEDGAGGASEGFNSSSMTRTTEGAFTRYNSVHTAYEVAGGTKPVKSANIAISFGYVEYDECNIIIQKIDVLKTSTKSLPSGSVYSYQLRNYTRTYSFSEFTTPIVGSPSREVFYLDMQAETDYVSPFNDTNVFVRSTTPLAYLNVETLPPDGEYVVPLPEVAHEINLADYTFMFQPLLNNCIVYDSFENDRELSANPDANGSIHNLTASFDSSPPRVPATWHSPGSSNAYLYVNHSSKFWLDTPDQAYRNRSFVVFQTYTDQKYKEYDITKVAPFYRGILGNANHGSNFNHKDPKNTDKFSLGLIFRISEHSEVYGENSRIARGTKTFTFHVYPHTPNTVELVLAIRGNNYDWRNPDNGDIVLRHTMAVSAVTSDYFYLHASADCNALNDPQRTYMSIHKVSNDTDNTVINQSESEVLINNTSSTTWNWVDEQDIKLGFTSPSATGDYCKFTCDTFYVTADVIERKTIDNIVAPLLSQTRNPHYPTFGYSTEESFRITAEALPVTAAQEDHNEGSVPLDADTLRGEISLTADWEEPDGTCVIVREAFTHTQMELDEINATQTHTYTKSVKIIAAMSSTTSPITDVRFSNDQITWSNWRTYSGEIMYPWDLLALWEDPNDTEEGGLRTAYIQTVTDVGIASDYVLDSEHSDIINFNPIGSIGGIESWNYLAGYTGWKIDLTGVAEFSDVFIRNRAVNSGKNINNFKLKEHNIGTQLGPEVFTFEKDRAPEPIYFGGTYLDIQHMDNYNSDIAVDLYNNSHVYIPYKSAAGNFYCYLYHTDVGQIVGVVEVDNDDSVDEYGQTHVALTKEHVYVAGGNYVKKYRKDNFTTGAEVAVSGHLNYMNQGIRLAYNSAKELRVYVLQSGGADVVYFLALDEDLSIVSATTVTVGTTYFEPYMSKTWDCNGLFLSFFDFRGKIYSYKLNTSGEFDDNDLDQWKFDTVAGEVDLEEAFTHHKNLMRTYNAQDTVYPGVYLTGTIQALLLRRPTGLRLFGDVYMYYPIAGNDSVSPQTAYLGYYNTIGIGKCERDATTTGITSLIYLAHHPTPEFGNFNNPVTMFMPSAYTVSVPQEPSVDFPNKTVNMLPHTYNMYAPYTDSALAASSAPHWDMGCGCSTPVIADGKIHIGYSTSDSNYTISSIYSFDFDGRSIAFNNPKILTHFSNFAVSSVFQNGQHFYSLLNKLTKVNNVWTERVLFISKY